MKKWKRCPYFKTNPNPNECAIMGKDEVCELAHTSSRGFKSDCFIFQNRALYLKNKRNV